MWHFAFLLGFSRMEEAEGGSSKLKREKCRRPVPHDSRYPALPSARFAAFFHFIDWEEMKIKFRFNLH